MKLYRVFPVVFPTVCICSLFFTIFLTYAAVNINEATEEDLVALPGIGKTTAEAIIKYRTEQGKFNDINDLLNVKGIGESQLNKIKNMITVDSTKSDVVSTQPITTEPAIKLEDVLSKFSNEPTITEIQQAALNYAMIYPDEITSWRKGAKSKALLPQFKMTVDRDIRDHDSWDRGNNIDIDGGSVVVGPDDYGEGEDIYNNWGFGVDFTWKFGDYVFSKEMLDVRGESEDLVQLRQDILNDVTKLYFDRRRLQAEMILQPSKNIKDELRNELRLQELTANIDALTGGYLTTALTAKKN